MVQYGPDHGHFLIEPPKGPLLEETGSRVELHHEHGLGVMVVPAICKMKRLTSLKSLGALADALIYDRVRAECSKGEPKVVSVKDWC